MLKSNRERSSDRQRDRQTERQTGTHTHTHSHTSGRLQVQGEGHRTEVDGLPAIGDPVPVQDVEIAVLRGHQQVLLERLQTGGGGVRHLTGFVYFGGHSECVFIVKCVCAEKQPAVRTASQQCQASTSPQICDKTNTLSVALCVCVCVCVCVRTITEM